MPYCSNNSDSLECHTDILAEIVRQHGTPTYAFDVQGLRRQVEKLQTHLPDDVGILYSLKANASLGICDVFRKCGIGADVASAGELATAIEAGFSAENIFVAGPFKLPETISQLIDVPQAIVSVDSPSELRALAVADICNPLVLRLRPDFGSCAVVKAGCESRFGFSEADISQCRGLLSQCGLDVIGFHIFSGSQVLAAEQVNGHLSQAVALSLKAADLLGITPSLINLGGGFGIPYGSNDADLDLAAIGEELARLIAQAASARFVLELGRYLVAEAGWYLTSVVGHQTVQHRPAVVVDGGVHQRADMCGLKLRTQAAPPLVLGASPSSPTEPTDIWGCLSLPDDILAEAAALPELSTGDVLAFSNAGAYGLWSSPAMFHGSPLPVEVAFDGDAIHVMRDRKAANSILDDQRHVVIKSVPAHS
jgi:diaminopimelate decarboxylase